MTVMRAKYAGRDSGTGRRFAAGTVIDYDRIRKTVAVLEPGQAAYDAFVAGSSKPDDVKPDDGKYISHVFRIGGRDYYRNKRGTCEDAPCCGCCTI